MDFSSNRTRQNDRHFTDVSLKQDQNPNNYFIMLEKIENPLTNFCY